MKTLWLVFRTEIFLSLRSKADWLYPIIFFIVVICLFPLGLTPDPVFLQKIMPGCIWIAALLASLLAIENLFSLEIEEGYLEQLLLSSQSLAHLIFVKLCAKWLITELPLILITPLLASLFHLSPKIIGYLCLSLLLGTPILIWVGALGAALLAGLREQGIFLALLVLPLLTPVLIFGVTLIQQVDAHLPLSGPLSFLAGLLILTICLLPIAIAATLRISLDD